MLDRTLVFSGPIQQGPVSALRVALVTMVNEGATKITLLFASAGGSTDEGIALFSFLRALQVELTMHAIGHVGSIAVPVFLAAPIRLTSKNAYFFFHEFSWAHEKASDVSSTTVKEQDLLLDAALLWTKEIVKANTKLTDTDFEKRKLFRLPVIYTPREAATAGIVSGIAEPTLSANTDPRTVIW